MGTHAEHWSLHASGTFAALSSVWEAVVDDAMAECSLVTGQVACLSVRNVSHSHTIKRGHDTSDYPTSE